MSGPPVPTVYDAAARMALAARRIVVLVETRERREGDWWETTRKLAPKSAKLLVTPKPGGRA